MYGEAEQEVLVGSFAARFDDTLQGGGVVAQGASMAGREDMIANSSASIAIAGIPTGATVQRALLYWQISNGADTTATVNATAVTGVQVAVGGQTCWGFNNTMFRADVTALVAGNGVYTIADLPSATAATSADTNGVSLVVVYQDPSSGIRRRVMIRDGAITSSESGEIVTDTFTGVMAPIASTGQFHILVGDGQAAFTDGALNFNSVLLGANQFPGGDGSLWDTNTYDVTVPAALANGTWTSQTTNDCLAYSAAVLDWNVGVCGDSVRSGGEACDQGNMANGDGCTATCTVEPGWSCTAADPSVCTPICGDGVIIGTETCDDGNANPNDGCSATCAQESGWSCTGTPSTCVTTCGDGIVAGAELCDDTNTAANDGCSATCTIEMGWSCAGNPSVCTTSCGDGILAGSEMCDDNNNTAMDGCSAACALEPGWSCTGSPSVCTTTCGDGVVAGVETCDDNNMTAGDGCSAACLVETGWTCTGAPSACDEVCGDGLVVGTEACDDGDTDPNDGCSATCTVEAGWSCAGAPSTCTANCGDGQLAGSEACDDGNTASDDGCSATCTVEAGWSCTGTPSACTVVCGDGLVTAGEQCDDANTTAGDGCDATCVVEPAWECDGALPTKCTKVPDGCGCATGGTDATPLAALVLLLVVRRRRRAPSRFTTTSTP